MALTRANLLHIGRTNRPGALTPFLAPRIVLGACAMLALVLALAGYLGSPESRWRWRLHRGALPAALITCALGLGASLLAQSTGADKPQATGCAAPLTTPCMAGRGRRRGGH